MRGGCALVCGPAPTGLYGVNLLFLAGLAVQWRMPNLADNEEGTKPPVVALYLPVALLGPDDNDALLARQAR